MTKYRKNPEDISNHIDDVLDGIGARGSSFTDVDRLTMVHNGTAKPPRFLLQELKWGGEECDSSKRWLLRDAARIPHVDAWLTRVIDSNTIEVTVYPSSEPRQLSNKEYRELFADWWFPGQGRRVAS